LQVGDALAFSAINPEPCNEKADNLKIYIFMKQVVYNKAIQN
jgi:hypothetical protein